MNKKIRILFLFVVLVIGMVIVDGINKREEQKQLNDLSEENLKQKLDTTEISKEMYDEIMTSWCKEIVGLDKIVIQIMNEQHRILYKDVDKILAEEKRLLELRNKKVYENILKKYYWI